MNTNHASPCAQPNHADTPIRPFTLNDLLDTLAGVEAFSMIAGVRLYSKYFQPSAVRVKRRKGCRTRVTFTRLSLIQLAQAAARK